MVLMGPDRYFTRTVTVTVWVPRAFFTLTLMVYMPFLVPFTALDSENQRKPKPNSQTEPRPTPWRSRTTE